MIIRKLIQICFLTAMCSGMLALAEPPLRGFQIMKEAKWKDRLLLICGAEHGAATSALFKAQKESVDWQGYAERNISIIGVSPNAAIVLNTSAYAAEIERPASLGFFEAQSDLIEASRCETGDPSITLIGKDGRVKQRWDGPVLNEELFATIDAMPMRQSEMRQDQ